MHDEKDGVKVKPFLFIIHTKKALRRGPFYKNFKFNLEKGLRIHSLKGIENVL